MALSALEGSWRWRRLLPGAPTHEGCLFFPAS